MKKTLLIAISLMSLVACGMQNANEGYYVEEVATEAKIDAVEEYKGIESDDGLLAFNDAGTKKQTQPSTTKPKAQKSDKKIIKTADIRAEVEELKAARGKLNELIKKYNAYTFSENTENSYYEISTKLTIRMTPENFEPFINSIEGITLSPDYKRINAKDVTAEFKDISARLNTKRDALNRYREILKKANTVKEILEVEDKMRQIVEEIEVVEGRLKYLRDQVGYSTVNLDLYEKSDQPIAKKRSFFTQVGKAFGNGWEGFLGLVLGLITIWPLLLIVGGLIYLAIRWKRGRNK